VVDWETSARLLFLAMLALILVLMTFPQLVAVNQFKVPTRRCTLLVEVVQEISAPHRAMSAGRLPSQMLLNRKSSKTTLRNIRTTFIPRGVAALATLTAPALVNPLPIFPTPSTLREEVVLGI
jgi:hypothetical protein